SPTHSWYCGDTSGYYINNMDCYIQTIPFMINANSSLKFYRWFHVPLYGTDGIYIIIMGDGFADTLDFIGTGGALGGRGILSNWFEEEYSLSEYPAGETIQVRIAFISDNDGDIAEGFYIDDFTAEYITMLEEYTDDRITTLFLQVHPNPFRHKMDIEYCIGQSARGIELKIYDVSGRLIKEFNLQSEICNLQSVKWSGTDQLDRPVAAGVYFVRLETTDHCLTKKAILLR
ncbi:T9SS type A sorting domain-containing protein, partial [candidate division WOR-3 bacterium]|nr:T9SS type A sorting domain-containing protein [candidate division WOR-3 bacterium]